MTLQDVSIIIPLGPHEDQWAALLDDLSVLSGDVEIIIVSCDGAAERQEKNRHWISSPPGRAVQQNAGAKVARGKFLWFLHGDSRVTPQGAAALDRSLQVAPDALHFFRLKFIADGPGAMWLNEWGVRFRAEILKIPFGDQGFCLRRETFNHMGGFPEDVAYGEDHLLVWHARQAGIKIRCVGAILQTSARKYRARGWGALTVKYQILWIKQALPEVWKLIRGKFNPS